MVEDEYAFDAGDWRCVAVRSDRPWGNGLKVRAFDRKGHPLFVVDFVCHPELPAYEELQAMSTSELIDLAALRLHAEECRRSLMEAREQGLHLILGFQATLD
ncbi:hypothetical protein CK489_31775 [Bradyrhizobium sp. UFLA03-84]|uniref:hypothetical protein n=1 Tax=Bradyrhizobium sp. UFLA03-84 TaxID=418599 RepID=UPI000BAE0BA1|nr:hypothetical protein [Bradyrhizobium sp. UFLA03-84]PAY05164.1 hypothetical protein CK489_31775 [Bradyrhizobium sp. UFLA03-84]